MILVGFENFDDYFRMLCWWQNYGGQVWYFSYVNRFILDHWIISEKMYKSSILQINMVLDALDVLDIRDETIFVHMIFALDIFKTCLILF